MRVFRIEREKHLEKTLKGIGAASNEGFRWNSVMTYLVYTSESRALAMWEVAVHLDLSEDFPQDRYLVEIEIPDQLVILEIDPADLPEYWDAKPPTLATQYMGDDFVQEAQAAILKVPSSIIPKEYNYLINPHHPVAQSIRVIQADRLHFDERLKKVH